MTPLPNYMLEVVNCGVWTLGLCLLVIFVRYIIAEVSANGFQRMRLRAGIALAVIICGEVIKSEWVWLARRMTRIDANADWMLSSPWGFIPLLGGGIMIVGLLCAIRVFSPDEWGRRAWIICGLLSAVVTLFFSTTRW